MCLSPVVVCSADMGQLPGHKRGWVQCWSATGPPAADVPERSLRACRSGPGDTWVTEADTHAGPESAACRPARTATPTPRVCPVFPIIAPSCTARVCFVK